MSDLNDLFKQLAKLKAEDSVTKQNKSIESGIRENFQSDLDSLLSEFSSLKSTKATKKEQPQLIEEVLIEAPPITKTVEIPMQVQVPADDMMSAADKYLKSTQPEVPEEDASQTEMRQINNKIKFLEGWLNKINNAGPGSGEVNLRYLDDVARLTIADGLNLQYNATSKKFEFTRPLTSAYHVTRVHETVQTLDHSVPQIITDMTLSPPAGTYIVNYNSKFAVIDTSSLTSAAKVEVTALYADLSTRSATGSETSRTASDIYANETLGPGVYIHTGAITVNGKLTLDASGDPAAEFIIRTAGAFTTGTFAEIELTGGATSSNVWFVTAGAPSTGANTIFRGNFIADQAAPSLGATTSFEGRMFAVNGAIAIGEACTITAPTGTGIEVTTSIGSLVVFSLFTGLGAVSNTGTVTTVALSIGTDGGAITGFPDGNVGGNLYPGGAGQSSRLRIGVYVDGVLLNDSRRQYDHAFQNIDEEFQIVMQSVVTVTDGQDIDIRGSAAFGEVAVGPRMSLILTLIQT